MKRITVTVLMVIFFLHLLIRWHKRKEFAGTVTFSIKYEGDIDPQKLANALRH